MSKFGAMIMGPAGAGKVWQASASLLFFFFFPFLFFYSIVFIVLAMSALPVLYMRYVA
jgi:hypothetical protein